MLEFWSRALCGFLFCNCSRRHTFLDGVDVNTLLRLPLRLKKKANPHIHQQMRLEKVILQIKNQIITHSLTRACTHACTSTTHARTRNTLRTLWHWVFYDFLDFKPLAGLGCVDPGGFGCMKFDCSGSLPLILSLLFTH